jgi:hypothetical protein
MPWEAPLQRILESIEGPVAKVIAVVIIITTGLSLSFGDMGGALPRAQRITWTTTSPSSTASPRPSAATSTPASGCLPATSPS